MSENSDVYCRTKSHLFTWKSALCCLAQCGSAVCLLIHRFRMKPLVRNWRVYRPVHFHNASGLFLGSLHRILYVERSFKVRMITASITTLMKRCILHLKVVVFVGYCPRMFLETLNMAILEIYLCSASYSGVIQFVFRSEYRYMYISVVYALKMYEHRYSAGSNVFCFVLKYLLIYTNLNYSKYSWQP